MLEIYRDDSGSHNDKLMVAGGFVGTSDKCEQFCAECERIKREFFIQYFHAVELGRGRTRRFRDPSKEQRDRLRSRLGEAIARMATGSCTSTWVSPYGRTNSRQS